MSTRRRSQSHGDERFRRASSSKSWSTGETNGYQKDAAETIRWRFARTIHKPPLASSFVTMVFFRSALFLLATLQIVRGTEELNADRFEELTKSGKNGMIKFYQVGRWSPLAGRRRNECLPSRCV
jgi:hypothetical protein